MTLIRSHIKDNIRTLTNPNVGIDEDIALFEDTDLALVNSPYVTDELGVEWKDYQNDVTATAKNLRSINTNGTTAYLETDSYTFKSIGLFAKPVTANEEIYEISSGETLAFVSGSPIASNFTSETLTEVVKGDWSMVGISQSAAITGSVDLGRISTNYGAFNSFRLIMVNDEVSAANWTWFANNPQATLQEVCTQFGVTANSLGGTLGQGVVFFGDINVDTGYMINLAVAVGNQLFTNSTFESGVSGWSAKSSVVSYNTTNPISGNGCIRFDNAIGNALSGFYQNVGLDANSYYYIIGSARVVSGGTQDLRCVQVTSTGGGQENVAILKENANESEVINFKIIYKTISDVTKTALQFAGGSLNSVLDFDDLYIYKISAATNYNATEAFGDTGLPEPLMNFNTDTINNSQVLLPKIKETSGISYDILGNQITVDRSMGINISPFSYSTFTPITILKSSGAIYIDFILRDFISGNTDGLQSLLGNGSASFKFVTVDGDNGNIVCESDTDTDYWTQDTTGTVSELSYYRLIINADSGTVKTYLNGTLIDTQTPTDDLTLAEIANSIDTVRMNGLVRRMAIYNKPLSQSKIDLLSNY